MKFNNFPENTDVTQYVCSRPAVTTDTGEMWTWKKNPKATMVYIFLLGHGGNGSPGLSVPMGGAGGGGGGQLSILIPAMLLPETLYCLNWFVNTPSSRVGVSTLPESVSALPNIGYATGGLDSTGVGVPGNGGAAGARYAGLGGIVNAVAGQQGTIGGSSSGVAGTDVLFLTNGYLASAGAGGGAGSAAGGSIQASAPRAAVTGGAIGVQGSHGYSFFNGALLPCGGSGGGGSAAGNGGDGGNGGFGSGGGGGGGTSGTQGQGGLGGPGLIVIAQW